MVESRGIAPAVFALRLPPSRIIACAGYPGPSSCCSSPVCCIWRSLRPRTRHRRGRSREQATPKPRFAKPTASRSACRGRPRRSRARPSRRRRTGLEVAFPKLQVRRAAGHGRRRRACDRLFVAERHRQDLLLRRTTAARPKGRPAARPEEDGLRPRASTRSSPRTATSTSPTSPIQTRPPDRARALSRFSVKADDPPHGRPGQREGDPRVALRRAQRRLPALRPRRLPLPRHRRRQRHRRRACRPARTSATCSASILRIDVDKPDAGQELLASRRTTRSSSTQGRPAARSGPTACGSRGSISFDRQTGDLWAGEVGQDLWEMVYRIEKGGNYGWSVHGGHAPVPPRAQDGARRRSCRRSSSTTTPTSARSPAATSTTASGCRS